MYEAAIQCIMPNLLVDRHTYFCDDNQEEKRLGIEEGLGDIVCYQLVVHSPSSS